MPVTLATPAGQVAVLGFSERWTGEYQAGPEQPGALVLAAHAARSAVLKARAAGARSVVAYVHWGDNYAGVHKRQRKYAKMLVSAGIDLIIGHHPHVIQPMERVDHVPVLWSLGNFVFGTPGRWRPEFPGVGLIATTRFGPGGLEAIEFQCVDVDNRRVLYQPHTCAPKEQVTAWSRLGPDVVIEADRAIWRVR